MSEDMLVVSSFFPRPITVPPIKTKDFARWNDFPHFRAARQCLINFNSQVNAQPGHRRLLFVNKQHQNCANIDAAMNYSESTSSEKGFIAILSVNKLLIIFTVSFDVFDGQSSTLWSFQPEFQQSTFI